MEVRCRALLKPGLERGVCIFVKCIIIFLLIYLKKRSGQVHRFAQSDLGPRVPLMLLLS